MEASCGLHDVPYRGGLLICWVSRDWQPDIPPSYLFQHHHHRRHHVSKGRPSSGDNSSIGTIHPTQRSSLCSQRGINAEPVWNHRRNITEPSRNHHGAIAEPAATKTERTPNQRRIFLPGHFVGSQGIARRPAVVAKPACEFFHQAAV